MKMHNIRFSEYEFSWFFRFLAHVCELDTSVR
jgi:hypothetical protein